MIYSDFSDSGRFSLILPPLPGFFCLKEQVFYWFILRISFAWQIFMEFFKFYYTYTVNFDVDRTEGRKSNNEII